MFYLRFYRDRIREFPWLKRPLLLLTALNLVLGATAVGFAYVSKLVLDDILQNDVANIVFNALLLAGFIVFQLVLKTTTNYLATVYQTTTHKRLQDHYVKTLLGRTLPAIQSKHTGLWMNHLDSDVVRFSHGVLDIAPRFAFMAFRFVLAFVLLAYLDWMVALVLVGFGGVLLIIALTLREEMKRRHVERQDAEGAVRSFLQEQLDHAPVIKSYQAETYTLDLLRGHQTVYADKQIRSRRLAIVASTGLQAGFMLAYALVIVLGAYRITLGALTVGGLVAILQLTEYMQSPFRIAGNLLPAYSAMESSFERLQGIAALEVEATDRVPVRPFDRIVIDNLHFSYGASEILNGLSFEVRQGSLVHLAGPSGIGKTTFLYLLLGLLRPTGGNIALVHDDDTQPIGPETRSYFAFVPQQIRIVSGTIRDNLRYNRDEIDDNALVQACQNAVIDKDIEALPNGYDTVVGERGLGMSEGQLQRLAIARALLSEASVLILDEATSALDKETEQLVLANLRQLPDKTIILVSHRDVDDDMTYQRIDIGHQP